MRVAKGKVSLDVTEVGNFIYDMTRCIKCKGCYWVEHTYMPGIRFTTRCPSMTWKKWDTYGAPGKMRLGVALQEGRLTFNDTMLEVLYACTLCGACDVGCKRNLDLEIELALESLRIKAVKEGAAPLPQHRRVVENILQRHNRFGAPNENRGKWLRSEVKVADRADVLYFVGCASSFVSQEIALSTARILNMLGIPFTLMEDEWCCGNVLYSVGMFDEAKKLAERNIQVVREKGIKRVVTSCAEGYRMWKVDYPKMLNIATSDLGFEVKHIIEVMDDALKEGKLSLTQPQNVRFTYHDACSISRLCDPWIPWSGERGWMGMVSPPLKRRRGQGGLYFQARAVLNAIPGGKFVEMPRTRENAFCCGAGRGTKEAFPELASFAASHRLEEVMDVGAEVLVTACPWCKENFTENLKDKQTGIRVMDITELVASALGGIEGGQDGD
ncbi:MAG: hypothetical protein DRI26_04100 [Chloroflexi bacterium]|nr:MAG: hypothetical protein DRI26_04100 [Chloroflexota bacterium]